jgi:hypothetical protein
MDLEQVEYLSDCNRRSVDSCMGYTVCSLIDSAVVVQKLSGNPVWEAAFEEVFSIALCGNAGPEKWAVSRWTSGRHERTLALWVAMQRTLYHQKRMTPADVQRFEVNFPSGAESCSFSRSSSCFLLVTISVEEWHVRSLWMHPVQPRRKC